MWYICSSPTLQFHSPFHESSMLHALFVVYLYLGLGGIWVCGFVLWMLIYGMACQTSIASADGLVGYDTALTRRGSRVQFPDCVVVFLNFFLILFYNGYNKID